MQSSLLGKPLLVFYVIKGNKVLAPRFRKFGMVT